MTATTARITRRIAAAAALAATLAIAGQAAALPPVPVGPGDDGPLVPIPNVPPVAALTVTPNPATVASPLVIGPRLPGGLQPISPALLGTLVTFDASASRDLDGDIVQYQWDLDGDGTFEKTTTTPTTTRRYSEPGTPATKVRVRDNRGATRIKSVVLTLHRAPVARITASRTVILPGDSITLNGGTSTDDNGIAKHEWDLDGNGTFERTGVDATTSFGATGTRSITLRVTDVHGATRNSTVSIRVHRQATAAFAVNPVTPGVGQQATLDAGLSDDDGSITRYEWDLDGNGSFETDGGATPTTTTTFATAGPATVGLRVTDNDGVTAQSTRTIQVAPQVVITDTVAPKLKPATTLLRMNRNGRAGVRLTCPVSEDTCTVTVRLRGLKAPFAGRYLGTATRTIAGGRTVTVNVGLSAKAKQQLRRGKRIQVRAIVTTVDAVGNRSITRTAARLTR